MDKTTTSDEEGAKKMKAEDADEGEGKSASENDSAAKTVNKSNNPAENAAEMVSEDRTSSTPVKRDAHDDDKEPLSKCEAEDGKDGAGKEEEKEPKPQLKVSQNLETTDSDQKEVKTENVLPTEDEQAEDGDVEATASIKQEEEGVTVTHAHEAELEMVKEEADDASAVESIIQDPNIGKTFEQSKLVPSGTFQPLVGTVSNHTEASGRIPSRWTVEWDAGEKGTESVLGEEWVAADLLPAENEPPQPSKALLDIIQTRYQDAIKNEMQSNNLVTSLFMVAALEEALQTYLTEQQEVTAESNASGADGTKKTGAVHPPQYYTTNPTTYLRPPTQDFSKQNVNAPRGAVLTPTSLTQRIRSGSQWARDWLEKQQPVVPVAPTNNTPNGTARRRTARQTKPVIAPHIPIAPIPVKRGGRVAMWWIQQLEAAHRAPPKPIKPVQTKAKKAHKKIDLPLDLIIDTKRTPKKSNQSAAKNEEEGPGDETAAETVNNPKMEDMDMEAAKKVAEDDGYIDALEEFDREEAANGDDDEEEEEDDDYTGGGEGEDEEDDEELEGVERERAALDDVPKATKKKRKFVPESDKDEESEEEEEAEELDENQIYFDNPYLQPSYSAYLEYMTRAKALSPEDIQAAISDCAVRIKNNKRACEFGLPTASLQTVDDVVLNAEIPDYPSGKVALKCVSGETFSELQKLDPQSFNRCKFSLDIINDQELTRQVVQQQAILAKEIEYKEAKAWDRWRYKGIHEGYCRWPSWEVGVRTWIENNAELVESKPEAMPAPAKPSEDEELASMLEEEAPGRRRTTRRGGNVGPSEGVFYGNQSQLTQKQLMDAIIRIVKANQFQSLMSLQTAVANDSSDPIRRSRIALGRLVWKRNQLIRMPVCAEWSDTPVKDSLAANPLLTIDLAATAEKETGRYINRPLEKAEEELIEYLQTIQQTELQLRSLILKHLSQIPPAIIATAADERNGLESMDNADFEDPGSIEWHSSGHELIGERMYRPTQLQNATDISTCRWFEVKEYSQSILSTSEEVDDGDANEDIVVVERRMRFRVISQSSNNEEREEIALILTEGQVRAGMKAGELQKQETGSSQHQHPFADGRQSRISIHPENDKNDEDESEPILAQVVGHDTLPSSAPDSGGIVKRILILPQSNTTADLDVAFWATLHCDPDDLILTCKAVESPFTVYRIEQFDYDSSSTAFQECKAIVTWLKRQSKAQAFQEPVDPVALGVPQYFEVVKNPMDVSTLEENLEAGKYSTIPLGQTSGRTPVARMLNGPFKKEMDLIFDNAMLFNPPDDWIHQAAAGLKKAAHKKIAEASAASDQTSKSGRGRQPKSLYFDEDSDVDMYEYESEKDEDYSGGRGQRKRKRPGRNHGTKPDDYSSRAIEHPVRLQSTLRSTLGLRGPFANLPINSDAISFCLQPEWGCRYSSPGDTRKAPAAADGDDDGGEDAEDPQRKKRMEEMAELLALQRDMDEHDNIGLRRSHRAPYPSKSPSRASNGRNGSGQCIEFFVSGHEDSQDVLPRNRFEIEIERERFHEEYYATLYQTNAAALVVNSEDQEPWGKYVNGSFPPYLGRVVSSLDESSTSWEIRSQFVVPAVRWVLRGLIESGHLTAVEPLTADATLSSGIVVTNDIYYWDARLKPYEVLDSRELQRRKRAGTARQDSDSEDDVEMSEYERLRAERVARNAERLKSLGL